MASHDVWKETHGLVDDPESDERVRKRLDEGNSGFDAEIRAAVHELVDRFAPPPPLAEGASAAERRSASLDYSMRLSAVRAAVRRFAAGD